MSEIVKSKRSKKLSLEFSKEEIKDLSNLSVGLTDHQRTRVELNPDRPLFITGYHLRNLEYLRRTITVQKAKRTRLYILDAARDLEDLEKDNISNYAVRYQTYLDPEKTTEFLKVFLEDSEEKTLVITSALETFNLEGLENDLLTKILATGAADGNVFLFSHSSHIALAKNKTEITQLIFNECDLICVGLMIYRDLREMIGEEKATDYKTQVLDKDDTVLLTHGNPSNKIFTPYKLTSKNLLQILG